MAAVILENIEKHFGDYHAIDNLNLHIKSGEFFTFLGPSGCGKTTTLRMVAGFSYPSSGKILFDDRDITYLNPSRRNIGMVFQNYALFPHLTIGENVAFGLKVRKVDRATTRRKVGEALERVHLGGYETRKVNQISGGQQQRVALARALVIEPDILLLDEPLSNLDAKLREETRTEIRRLQLELGITAIYVTHDQGEAMAVSDRIMIMKRGVSQQVADPYTIYNKPENEFVATFIGKNNILTGQVVEITGSDVTVRTNDGLILKGLKENVSSSCRLAVGAAVAASVRPEGFHMASLSDTGANIVRGTVEITEYTGMNVDYFVRVGSSVLNMTFFSMGATLLRPGEEIGVSIPASHIYFMAAENVDTPFPENPQNLSTRRLSAAVQS